MSRKKNLILITIDCLRHDHLSCLGYHRTTSPNIDDLAERGALFHQAIANGPNTFCSFPPILTSTYPLMNLLGNEKGFPPNWIFISKENPTIAEVLKRMGYSTAAFHSNPWVSSFFNYNRGFDRFEDFLGKSVGESLILRQVSLRHKAIYYLRLLKGLGKVLGKQNIDIRCLNRMAISWLKKRDREPFFLWLHYMDLHAPYVAPNSTISELLAAIRIHIEIDRTHKCLSERYLRALKNFYDKKIMFVDQEIGFLLNELEKMGFSNENTYVILTADHGEQFMEHGFVGHGLLYDEVIRVPLIICGPEIDAHVAVKSQVSLLDLCPTIVDLLGINKVESFWGTSLLPVMLGEKKRRKNWVFSESISPTGYKEFALRSCSWKYIFGDNGQRKRELYNLCCDPKETRNLVSNDKERSSKFKLVVLKHIRRERTLRKITMEKEAIERRIKNEERVKARLRALGYIN